MDGYNQAVGILLLLAFVWLLVVTPSLQHACGRMLMWALSLIGRVFKAFFTLCVKLVAKRDEAVEGEEPNSASDDTPEAKPESAASAKKYRKHADLGQAVVDVWFDPEAGKTKRTVRVRDEKLAETLGAKFQLPEIDYIDEGEAEAIMEQTINEVKAKLEGRPFTAEVRSVKPKPKKPEGKPAGKTGSVPKGPPRLKPKSRHTGEILHYGPERKIDGKGSEYETFALHLLDKTTTETHEMCGVDLQRAIRESRVKIGDQVAIEFLGKTQVTLPDGSTGNKNLWSVSKI